MTKREIKDVCKEANEIARQSWRAGAPTLTPRSGADEVRQWLLWCGGPGAADVTSDTMWQAVANMVSRDLLH